LEDIVMLKRLVTAFPGAFTRSALVFTTASLGIMAPACCPEPLVKEEPKVVAPPPDQDGDGVIDADDRCPAVAGVLEYGGCPDNDGDGIPDDVDRCPDVKGIAAEKGCPPPDTDKDGIIDADDACPNEAGPVETKGCPDKDGDSVRDADDKCPDQAGVPEEAGCLPKAVQKFSGSIKGITFAAGKATIAKSSNKTLDEAVAALAQYPSLRVEIQGHTDDQGPDDVNLKLSQDRAEAVKAYLVGKGIAAERLDAKGYGETVPVGDNKKAAGRAQNRRTEFKILGGLRRALNL
jgi:outer membrane protein OmpA-like peptidoglycan-associated protein